ncbi:MAG: glycoside hydrolase family 1 protein [Lewinellaceae bacterium]|nr:glycoside hydrolase family 1 protein [Lewinellaceae bacterium]
MNKFPQDFFFGTSTAAAQIETAGDHTWKGLKALDGQVFDRTTDHELRRTEDAVLIARLGTVYRCGVDWSRLQTAPMGDFHPEVVAEYQQFFADLQQRGVRLMLVLHHFCHPNWFEARGGWTNAANIPLFMNYATQFITHFGEYATYWNTFNEPNVYAMNGFMLGNFPPLRKGCYFEANRVLDHMGRAHDQVFDLLKSRFPEAPVGISLNTAWFEGANFLGQLVAKFVDWWFMERAARPFERCDFWGLSYYAYMVFDPAPMDAITRAADLEKRGIPHDRMWGYRPEGLGRVMRRFWKRYQKPIIVTENGICTDDPDERIRAIRDYLRECQKAIADGVALQGYIHWSTWDNFEWHLGRQYRFGLMRVDFDTMERQPTAASNFYEKIVRTHEVDEA